MKKIIASTLLTLSLLLLVACGSNTQNQEKNLVGTWDGEKGTLELYDNKKSHSRLTGVSVDGTWSIKDGNVYIDREGNVYDLIAKIPDGEFSSLEFFYAEDGKQDSDDGMMFMKQ